MITIRKATGNDAKKIAKIINKTWRISYKGIIPNSILTKRTYKQIMPFIKNDIKSNNTTVLVAITSSDEIVGIVSGGTYREIDKNHAGELYAIYVLPNYQRQNIGKLLFMSFFALMKKHKFRSIILWTLKASKLSRNFYKKMGGKITKRKQIEISGKNFDAVAYSWSKLR